MPVAVKYLAAAASDPGRKRTNNEDRYWSDPELGVYLVVDGVGGQNAGEIAAETAVTVIRERLARPVGTTEERIREAIALANNEIHRLSQSREDWRGMACVLTLAVIEEQQVTIGHVGDSRLYLMYGGEIRKMTNDHSPVGEREDRGEIGELEAMRHPRRNEVFRDVGGEPHTPGDDNFIETRQFEMPADGALLLCSDGLSDLVDSAAILKVVASHAAHPRAAVKALIDAANEAGGKDNITVILVAGPRFAAVAGQPAGSVAATVVSPAAQNGRAPLLGIFTGRPAFLLYGILLASVLFGVFKPHFVDDGAGKLTLATGPVRGSTQWTVGPGDQDFPAIAAALAQAVAGDSVVVSPGRYAEPVAMKNGVDLLAEKTRETILAGGVSARDVRSARLSGFVVEGGLKLENSDLVATDLEISSATGAAVEIAGPSAASRITGCRIVNSAGAGVVIRDGAAPRLAHNLIAGNGKPAAKGPRPGVEILDAAHPVLVDNTIVDNGAEAIWTTPLVAESDLLRRNFFGTAPAATGPAGRSARFIRTVAR